MIQTERSSLLTFTDAAALKVKSLIDEEENPKLNLRVYITGGGCSGFQYGFTFDEEIQEDDFIVEKEIIAAEEDDEDGGGNGGISEPHRIKLLKETRAAEEEDDEDGGGEGRISWPRRVKLLIDPMSFPYLKGAKIDYREDINGSQFVITNPNAKTTCGCGSSFSA